MDDETDIDELGPVDWIVVEFPGSKFNGEIAPALADLVERDLIRVLDLLILKKESDGTLEAFELSDLDEAEVGGLRSHEAELAMLLSEEDVNTVAAAIEPGSSAAVLVWENTWAAPFGSAVRRAGGQLVASGRIPIQAMLAAIEADDEDDDQRRHDMGSPTTHAARGRDRPGARGQGRDHGRHGGAGDERRSAARRRRR